MLVVYAFVAVFTVQILAMSLLHPAWFTRFIRLKMERYYPDERFAQLYPGDQRTRVERFLAVYRAANTGIAVLGLALLGGLFSYMQRVDWDDGPVETLAAVYFMVQVSPLCLVAWVGARSNKKARERLSPEVKRTASLQRRGLFDFVSPFLVFLAVLGYFLFAAFVMYIEQHPFPGFAGALVNIGIVTLVYALIASLTYTRLYGRKSSPLETHSDRLRTTGVTVKVGVYTCIGVVVFVSLNFTLALLDLQRWEPFGQSVYFVTCAILCSIGLTAPPRGPEADGLGSSPVA
jgi:FtsH-binding integral membrane protein